MKWIAESKIADKHREALKGMGWTPQKISRIAHGWQGFKLTEIQKLCRVLGTTPNDLLLK